MSDANQKLANLYSSMVTAAFPEVRATGVEGSIEGDAFVGYMFTVKNAKAGAYDFIGTLYTHNDAQITLSFSRSAELPEEDATVASNIEGFLLREFTEVQADYFYAGTAGSLGNRIK